MPGPSGQATQDAILTQFRDRLISKVQDFTKANCVICDQMIPPSWPSSSRVCCTISLGPGRYPESMVAGGGTATLNKVTTIKVAPFIRPLNDKRPDLQAALLGTGKGLVTKYEREILRAIMVEEANGRVDPWMPTDSGLGLLRDEIAPADSQPPAFTPEGDWIGMSIDFAISFDWDLS